ncbi:1340_t:CDS:2 [Dentiscutata heterogama]|uniref:1340_t:CDS:1 n=1 Tax=Dentiscutata heterogama TaxID=1316150 RepID=A0ACA9M1F3_9GLOM|nr:1340_t:CDS:2 [Dentiscutata heterogama]
MNQMWIQSDSNSDVKIIAGNEPNIKEFSVHSSVLRSRSLYFQRALSERWKNQKHGIYIITKPNIHPKIFKLILDYILTGKNILHTSAEDSLNILVASDELELLDLAECAQKRLIEEFSPCFTKIIDKKIFKFREYGADAQVLGFIFSTPYFTLEKRPYYSKTLNSFIFSFTDQSNPILSRVKTERKDRAIWNNKTCGPSFVTDLCMKDSNRWFSYQRAYERSISNSNELIAEEYEVLAFDNDYNSMINIFLKILEITKILVFHSLDTLNGKFTNIQ